MIKHLTDRQKEVYDFIVEYTKEHLYPPTLDEIGNACYVSSHADVLRYLGVLELHGLIARTTTKKRCGVRTITLTGYKLVKENEP